MKSRLLIALFSLLSSAVVAQTDSCTVNLRNARTDYDQGNYDHAISILNSTLKGCNFNKHDQIDANKLLILCYLRVDKLEAANSTAATIMKIDPNYMPDKFKDDPRLSSLFDKFKPEPALYVSIGGGLNYPEIQVVHTYSVVHADDEPNLASYKSMIGYQLNAGIEKRVYKNLWAAAGFEYRHSNYQHTLDSVYNFTIHYGEVLSYFDFPLSVKFYFLRHALQPYVQGGADFSLLSRALDTTNRVDQTTSLVDQKDLLDRTAFRNIFDIGYFGAVGGSYSIKAFRVFANARYIYFPKFINKTGTRYADEVNLYKYYYIDDDFKMNILQFNIGISYTLLYKIRK